MPDNIYCMNCLKHLVAVVLLVGASAHSAGFDCKKAQSNAEKMICANAELSGLDDELAKAWKQHLRDNKFQDQFRDTQRRWIARRDECGDANCLKEVYLARLEQMASGKEYFLRRGQGDPLCESMVKAMNEELYRSGHGRVCAYDILQRQPGVQLPPWKKLDLMKEKELYKRFILASYVGEELWPAAFADPPPPAGQPIDPKSKRPKFPMPSDEYLNREWQYAVDAGFEFYRWDNPIPYPETDGVLLIRFTASNSEKCPFAYSMLFDGDLKMPKSNPEYRVGTVAFELNDQWYKLGVALFDPHVTGAINISKFGPITKSYGFPDLCGITNSQKAFKWE